MIGCAPEQVLVCSTGVIGVPLRVERILAAVPGLVHSCGRGRRSIRRLHPRHHDHGHAPEVGGGALHARRQDGASARMRQRRGNDSSEHGDDAGLHRHRRGHSRADAAARALRTVVRTTFNAITVDGDTSTNDTVLVLASGAGGQRRDRRADADYRRFLAALEEVCHSLALQIVGDGEGASHVIEIEVRGASSDARRGAGGAHHRRFAAGENNVCGRRSQLGPHPGGSRSRRSEVRSRADRNPHGRDLACRRGIEHPFSEHKAHQRLLKRLRAGARGSGRRAADARACGLAISRPITCTSTPATAPERPSGAPTMHPSTLVAPESIFPIDAHQALAG